MPVLPSSLALTNIPDGTLAVAADLRNNYAAIQVAANALIDALNDGAAGDVLGGVGTTLTFAKPPGYEYGYVENTAGFVNVSTTETYAGATLALTSSALTFDGSTAVIVEVYVPAATSSAAATHADIFLGDNGTGIAAAKDTASAASFFCQPFLRRRYTPSAGAHTYTVKLAASNATNQFLADNGATYGSIYLRVTKV